MAAVAILAEGSVGIALGMYLPVGAALVLLPDLRMTGGAIHGVRDGFAGAHARGIHLRVTLAASHLQVARAGHFADIHQHGTAIGGLQARISMAVHAIGVG